jgi:hypothetical protein
MPEKVFGWPLIEPLHTFPDDLLPKSQCFLGETEQFPSKIGG